MAELLSSDSKVLSPSYFQDGHSKLGYQIRVSTERHSLERAVIAKNSPKTPEQGIVICQCHGIAKDVDQCLMGLNLNTFPYAVTQIRTMCAQQGLDTLRSFQSAAKIS